MGKTYCCALGILLAVLFSAVAKAEIVSGKTDSSMIQESIAKDSVLANLMGQGVSADEAKEMVNQMSAQEILYFADNLDRSQAGGVVIWLLTVIVLVLLIVYLGRRV